mmetsp:Transcript_3008/g.8525  ORF Transcript_3008/g.8525 Transcript_3008/m.8525 type:complete len:233 (+) Transcript_3008:1051-1749(+)
MREEFEAREHDLQLRCETLQRQLKLTQNRQLSFSSDDLPSSIDDTTIEHHVAQNSSKLPSGAMHRVSTFGSIDSDDLMSQEENEDMGAPPAAAENISEPSSPHVRFAAPLPVPSQAPQAGDARHSAKASEETGQQDGQGKPRPTVPLLRTQSSMRRAKSVSDVVIAVASSPPTSGGTSSSKSTPRTVSPQVPPLLRSQLHHLHILKVHCDFTSVSMGRVQRHVFVASENGGR